METNSRPRFPVSDYLYKSRIADGPRTPQLLKGFEAIMACFSLHSEMVAILSKVQGLHIAMGVDMNPFYTPEEKVLIITSLCHQLLLCAPTRSGTALPNIIGEACRLGVLLYLKPAICQIPPCWGLSGKLKTCLDGIEMNTDTRGEVTELVLWLAFLGGTTALDDPNRVWFVAHLYQTTTILRMHGWDDVKSVLVKFLWVEKIHQRPFLNLWKEAIVTRKSNATMTEVLN
jgi:hypothetical protein